ncbi:MAG: hypothetical protein GQ538_13330 [Xanthomonadales bacterium]|nr:hypothetical protein [Xanthomonadales bacterium]
MAIRNNEIQKELRKQSKDLVDSGTESDAPEEDDQFSETDVFEAKTDMSDNVGGSSVEIDVEQLLADFEAEAPSGVDEGGRVRRRLEAIVERKRRHEALVDFEEYDLDS